MKLGDKVNQAAIKGNFHDLERLLYRNPNEAKSLLTYSGHELNFLGRPVNGSTEKTPLEWAREKKLGKTTTCWSGQTHYDECIQMLTGYMQRRQLDLSPLTGGPARSTISNVESVSKNSALRGS